MRFVLSLETFYFRDSLRLFYGSPVYFEHVSLLRVFEVIHVLCMIIYKKIFSALIIEYKSKNSKKDLTAKK